MNGTRTEDADASHGHNLGPYLRGGSLQPQGHAHRSIGTGGSEIRREEGELCKDQVLTTVL